MHTFCRWQADGPNEFGDWYTVVQSQQSHIVIEVREAKRLWNGAQHKPCLWPRFIIASIVLTKSDFDHEPHKTERKQKEESPRKKNQLGLVWLFSFRQSCLSVKILLLHIRLRHQGRHIQVYVFKNQTKKNNNKEIMIMCLNLDCQRQFKYFYRHSFLGREKTG